VAQAAKADSGAEMQGGAVMSRAGLGDGRMNVFGYSVEMGTDESYVKPLATVRAK